MSKILWTLVIGLVMVSGLTILLLRDKTSLSTDRDQVEGRGAVPAESGALDNEILPESTDHAGDSSNLPIVESSKGSRENQNLSSESLVLDDAFEPEPIEFAPDFTLTALDGTTTFTLSDFRGKKPVIVDFFAEHCPNCRRNLPKMEALVEQYGDRVEVILIGIDSESATRRFFANRPSSLPLVMQDSRVARNYELRFTNTKALINRDGSLRAVLHGQDIEEAHFLELIES